MFKELSDLIEKSANSAFQDYPVILWQLLATAVLLVVVLLLFWRPITKYIENKEKEEMKNIEDAKKKNEEATKIKEEMDAEYKKLQEEMSSIKKKLLQEAENEKERIINDAKLESERKRQELKIELANEIINQEEKIKETIKEVSLLAASKMLDKKLQSHEDEELVEKIISEIGEIKDGKDK